eukprot:765258-Hanusia_phi.AAC.1
MQLLSASSRVVLTSSAEQKVAKAKAEKQSPGQGPEEDSALAGGSDYRRNLSGLQFDTGPNLFNLASVEVNRSLPAPAPPPPAAAPSSPPAPPPAPPPSPHSPSGLLHHSLSHDSDRRRRRFLLSAPPRPQLTSCRLSPWPSRQVRRLRAAANELPGEIQLRKTNKGGGGRRSGEKGRKGEEEEEEEEEEED